MVLAKADFENENQNQKGIENENHYHNVLACTKSSHKRDCDNRKVYGVKGDLHV